ncbi:2-C-methyl-D-erythritol 4-phosphate cytidylyltransferase [Pedobacter ginsengisoli]|uniref:2-C-methyl-D-erythritol 4-phosphate cytidylyltransferase n=1 Tax=Pedobacter ginsengisoli TaxID=363852 RepID=A0A2D1U2P3_9SPHI|nr:2-C-methyl-D-erythritol 4-phosphate cytidylyltransferase [Pedobacter ginsengisoli]ATP55865.1 2-C-methyl-D-erythritol 4-phosphate cytidylyltransferase [Pedobacter ginsengisoli]
MKYYAILVAGGSGNRMQNAIAKQFLLLDGKPVLMHTLEAFHQCSLSPEILLVLNIHQHTYWEELCSTYKCAIPHQVIKGGEQRFHSVKNGLKAIKGKGIVAVHDAVRPLISSELISKSFEIAEEKGNCVVGITPTDSIRRLTGNQKSESLNRNEVALIQTPQTFNLDILRKSYEKPFRNEFTDDASVAEHSGFEINLIEGERVNIKITYPEDLEIASVFLKNRKSTP